MKPDQQQALDRIAPVVIAHLPLTARKAVLHDLLTLAPIGSPVRLQVSELLLNLHDHERAQLKFSNLSLGGDK